MISAGVSAPEILRAAISDAAKRLRVDKERGRLTERSRGPPDGHSRGSGPRHDLAEGRFRHEGRRIV